MLIADEREIGPIDNGTGLVTPRRGRTVTRRAEGFIHVGATLQVAGGLRCIRRRVGAMKKTKLGPGPNSANEGVDLLVRQHSAGALRKGRHCRATHSAGDGTANRGVVSDGQENGITQGDGRSSGSVRAVAPRTVLSVEGVELQNLIGRSNLGAWIGPSR